MFHSVLFVLELGVVLALVDLDAGRRVRSGVALVLRVSLLPERWRCWFPVVFLAVAVRVVLVVGYRLVHRLLVFLVPRSSPVQGAVLVPRRRTLVVQVPVVIVVVPERSVLFPRVVIVPIFLRKIYIFFKVTIFRKNISLIYQTYVVEDPIGAARPPG